MNKGLFILIVSLLFACNSDLDQPAEVGLIAEIEIDVIGDRPTFVKFEDNEDFLTYLDIKAWDEGGNRVSVTRNLEFFDVFVDNLRIDSRKVEDFPKGNVELVVSANNVSSNAVSFKVVDPTQDIKSIQLEFEDVSRSNYAVAGKSLFDFDLTVTDNLDEEITINNFDLLLNRAEFNVISNVLVEETGPISIRVRAYDNFSNTLEIESRADYESDVKTLPVIFHIVHNGDPVGTLENASSDMIMDELERANSVFRNEFSSDRKSVNAVDTYFQFALATEDETGNPLMEAGIERLEVPFENFIVGEGVVQYMFENMWDPRKYINVFVIEIDWITSNAWFSPVLGDGSVLEGVGSTTDPNYQLQTYLGVMLSKDHLNSAVLGHELGHMLGLAHVFSLTQDDCLNFDPDYVADTRNYTNNETYIDSEFRDGCNGGRFLATNIMDYHEGNYNSLTFDQRRRMEIYFENVLLMPPSIESGGKIKGPENWKGNFSGDAQIECNVGDHLLRSSLSSGFTSQ